MSEYIISKEQVAEINKAHGGMQIVTSWLSCYAIWDTSVFPPRIKHEDVAVTLPEIVRCRDCEFAAEYTTGALRCIGYLVEPWDYYEDKPSEGVKVEPDGFCAWGVRRKP